MGIAWTAAGLVWQTISPSDLVLPQRSLAASPDLPISTADDAQRTGLADLPIFGRVERASATAKQEVVASRAPYVLSGIYLHSEPDQSLAIIETSGNSALYRPGDTLPSGEVMEAIEAERALIRTAQGLEALLLPRLERGQTDKPDAPIAIAIASAGDRPQPQNGEAVVTAASGDGQRAIKRSVFGDQNSLLGLIGAVKASFVTTTDGRQGISLDDLGGSNLLELLGLKNGDVVTAINGFPIKGKASFASILNVVAQSESIRIEYRRDGAASRLVVPILEG